jgi:hypothetical protein
MELQGQYKLTYTLNRVKTEMVVEVELRENRGSQEPRQNLWSGHATLDGQPYEDKDLSHCVNARGCAEGIGIRLRNERKAKAKAEGDSFRIKKEEVK